MRSAGGKLIRCSSTISGELQSAQACTILSQAAQRREIETQRTTQQRQQRDRDEFQRQRACLSEPGGTEFNECGECSEQRARRAPKGHAAATITSRAGSRARAKTNHRCDKAVSQRESTIQIITIA